jgi:anti-sigma factor RsiW
MDPSGRPRRTGRSEVAAVKETTSFELACREFVELVTDYLEGALEPSRRAAMERHLEDCAFCADYLDQVRATIAATGRIRVSSIAPTTRATVLAAFADVLDNPIDQQP